MSNEMATSWDKPVEPKATDSASLWNYSKAPGWTDNEIKLLRFAIVKCSVGNWMDIREYFPDKTCGQLNLQAQRLFGQQSLAEFYGLHMDPKQVLKKNVRIIGPEVVRKNGCIVNTGFYMSMEELKERMKQNRKEYQMEKQEIDAFPFPNLGAYERIHDDDWRLSESTIKRMKKTESTNQLTSMYQLLFKLKRQIDHRAKIEEFRIKFEKRRFKALSKSPKLREEQKNRSPDDEQLVPPKNIARKHKLGRGSAKKRLNFFTSPTARADFSLTATGPALKKKRIFSKPEPKKPPKVVRKRPPAPTPPSPPRPFLYRPPPKPPTPRPTPQLKPTLFPFKRTTALPSHSRNYFWKKLMKTEPPTKNPSLETGMSPKSTTTSTNTPRPDPNQPSPLSTLSRNGNLGTQSTVQPTQPIHAMQPTSHPSPSNGSTPISSYNFPPMDSAPPARNQRIHSYTSASTHLRQTPQNSFWQSSQLQPFGRPTIIQTRDSEPPPPPPPRPHLEKPDELMTPQKSHFQLKFSCLCGGPRDRFAQEVVCHRCGNRVHRKCVAVQNEAVSFVCPSCHMDTQSPPKPMMLLSTHIRKNKMSPMLDLYDSDDDDFE